MPFSKGINVSYHENIYLLTVKIRKLSE